MDAYTPDSNNQTQTDSATEPMTNVTVNARPGERDGESTFQTGTSNHADMTETNLAMESLYVHDPNGSDDEGDNVVIGEDEVEEVDSLEDGDDDVDQDFDADLDEADRDDDVLTSPNRRSAGALD